ncbi:substrate-binding periplasmic protein [Colwelliaceae bacterium 6471]
MLVNVLQRQPHEFIVIIFSFILLFSVPAKAENIKVVTEYLAPYQVKNEDGSLGGFSTEVIHALFEITKDTADIEVMPWSRAYEIALYQKNVLIYSIAHTKIRDPHFKWLGGLTRERLYFWGLKSKFTKKVDSIEELKSLRVAVSRRSNAEQFLLTNNYKKIYPLISDEKAMNMLSHNRVDLIIGAGLPVKIMTEQVDLQGDEVIKVYEIADLGVDLSIAFNLSSDPVLVKRFQKAFKTLRKSGQLAVIQKKWGIHSE